MSNIESTYPYATRKFPVFAENIVATSQPLAAQAGLRMLALGGNAVDAALATAITLTVVEPSMNGIGGDMYAMVWADGELHALDSTGRSPAAWTAEKFAGRTEMPSVGWDTVTVPGQVAGWRALSARFGRLPFERLFESAIQYAEEGYAVSPRIAEHWSLFAEMVKDQPGFARTFLTDGTAPKAGERWSSFAMANTLREIARTGGESFYRGNLAAQIASFARATGGSITMEDLAGHKAEWVKPLSRKYRDLTLHEMPPNNQGIAALIALGILEYFDVTEAMADGADFYHLHAEVMKLAFADLYAHIGDRHSMSATTDELLDNDYLRRRATAIRMDRASFPIAGKPKAGGTVYLTTADASGMMVSFIQSNYLAFGSGVVVPQTGISLHNRGANFNLVPGHCNEVGPKKKPLHTIMPGFITSDGKPLMSFGVMGGFMQAQGHVQTMSRLADLKQNPQAIIDAPRLMVEPDTGRVNLEESAASHVTSALENRGHHIERLHWGHPKFGAAQAIQRGVHGYLGASDGRRDGQAVGF
ncbi:gamma-glutamyltransferase [Paraburkholderia sp. J67]|uniref:gamma-glutamyltransferase n=1 Tax=Paraburkholderia sp. J67 TaxID=2805435 RepID=UPI002ABDC8EC|nr:gamma-glutamyltransferase [Paraburkholderia sp. J67]